VVRASDGSAELSGLLGAKERSAVSAQIQQSTDLAVPAPDEQDALAGYFDVEKAPRTRQTL
jgi:hypothetical protein